MATSTPAPGYYGNSGGGFGGGSGMTQIQQMVSVWSKRGEERSLVVLERDERVDCACTVVVTCVAV